MYVPLRVQQKAYQAEGVNLDFYRDYNVSWNNVGIYFANPGALSCKESKHLRSKCMIRSQ